MFVHVRLLLPLSALVGVLMVATPSAARAVPPVARETVAADPHPRGDVDKAQLIAASGVAALGLGSLGAVALMSRRQRSYFARR